MEEAVAAASSAADSGLTKEEQEAVDAGILNLDGTLPIIKDRLPLRKNTAKSPH